VSRSRILGRTAKTIQRHLRLLEEAGLVVVLKRRRDGKGRFLGFKFRRPHLARAAARIRERREKNRAAYELKKKERQEANEARSQRRASVRPDGRTAGEASSGHSPGRSSGHSPEEAREVRAQERRRGYEWLFGEGPDKRPSQAITGASDAPSPSMSGGHQSPLGPIERQTNSVTIPFRFVDGIMNVCQKYTIRRQSSKISRNCRISKSATATLTSSSA